MTARNIAKPQQKVRKPKKPPRQNLSAQCDALFSKLVRRPARCYLCGSTDRLQCAHGFSRRYRAIRWDFRNAWCLCARCHKYYTEHPIEWDDWLRETWDDQYDLMRGLALEPAVSADSRPALKSLLADLRALEATT